MNIDPQTALPPLTGTIAVPGLEAAVTVHRDRWGIPHVRAGCSADMWFAQGFVTAQDRLFQVEYDRLRSEGRLASAVGTSALASDIFARRVRLAAAARAGYDALDADTQEMLRAYAAGLNAFLTTCAARPVELQALGHEPEPWQPWHPIGVFLVRHVLFATLGVKLFRARAVAALGGQALEWFRQEGPTGSAKLPILAAGTEAELRAIPLDAWDAELAALAGLREALAAGGSNSWAIAGSRTDSGKPMLAGDPHRLLEVPNVYAQIHLTAPGIDAIGLAFPGVPGVAHFGRTARVAWCVTNAQAEYQDLFIERFRRAGDALMVQTAWGWVAAEVAREIITVRDAALQAVNVVTTPHGPVVIGDPESGVALALRSTGLLEAGGSLRCVLPLLRAGTVAEADAALAHWVEPVNNYLLAGDGGTIRYRTAGRVPIRPEVDAWIPVPGWDGQHEWIGVIPDAELPRGENPPAGVLITANQRIAADAYPYLIGVDYADGHRARRIAARLAPLRTATSGQLAAVHRDHISLAALELRDRLLAMDDATLSVSARALRARLASWDGRMARDAEEPVLLAEVRVQLIRLLVEHPRFATLRGSSFTDEPAPVWPLELRIAVALGTILAQDAARVLGPGARWEQLLVEALERATAACAGQCDRRWGARHRMLPAHPLRGWSAELDAMLTPAMPELDGDLDTVFCTAGPTGISDLVLVASTARYVFDLGRLDAGGWIVPLGASGHPASAHFQDQQQFWVAGELIPILADWTQLACDAESTQQMVPQRAGE